MKAPEPAWSATYANDRRGHRHRCRCCNRILNAGEPVVMTRLADGKTWAIHEECAAKPYAHMTWRDAMVCWGSVAVRNRGFKVPVHPLELPATLRDMAKES